MPKTKISEFSATPANNTDIDSINIAEGCAPSGINDAIRELMAQLKDFQTGAVGDSFNGPVGTSTAAAGAFTTLSSTGNTTLGDASGDAITINGTATFANANPILTAGTANGVAYLNGSKVVTSGSALTFDGTTFQSSVSASGEIFKITGTGSGAYTTSVFQNTNAGGYVQQIFNVGASGASGQAGIQYAPTLFCSFGTLANDATTPITFKLNGTEQMRLTSTGLGIGTSSPTYKLDVQGSAGVGAQIYETSTGTNKRLRITQESAYAKYEATYSSGGNAHSWWNGGTRQMDLDVSGNLGLGVTPSAWDGSFKAFQVSNTSLFSQDSTGAGWWSKNARNVGGTWYYIGTGSASYIEQGAGAFKWNTAPSGTAGNAITFTQAMSLDASGNLMVGTTTPTANCKLTVTGAGISIAGGRGSTFALAYPDWSIYNTSSGNALAFDNGTERARIDSSGNLLIGTDIPAGTTGSVGVRKGGTGELILLANNGGLYQQAVGNYYLVTTAGGSTSDATLKTNVQQLSGALGKVCAMRGVNFEFISDPKCTADKGTQLGVIAQEVEAQYPEIVLTDDNGKKTVRYDRLVAPLIEAIKEQQAIIESLKARLDAANL